MFICLFLNNFLRKIDINIDDIEKLKILKQSPVLYLQLRKLSSVMLKMQKVDYSVKVQQLHSLFLYENFCQPVPYPIL